jgi:hypothetical protein
VVKNNPARATNAHVSIAGHTTRHELLRNLDDTEKANGFANRFLWFCVQRSKLLPFGGSLRDEDLAPVVQRIRDTVDFARKLGETCLEWEPEADQLWRRVYPQLSEGRPGLLGAVTSRAEAQTIRLALIYALTDCSRTIRRPHLEAALAVWSYCAASAKFIFGDALGDPVADQALVMLRRAGAEGMTKTEISAAFGRHKPAGDLSRALGTLAEQGLARSRREETGGRPGERWFALLTRERSDKSEEGSGDVLAGTDSSHTSLSSQPSGLNEVPAISDRTSEQIIS